MRSFLLGAMPEPARRALEDEFFENDEVYESLQDSLNDLIDAYARGELNVAEKRLVEERILGSARNRTKLTLARALAQREQRHSSRPRITSPRRWIAVAASLAAVCFAGMTWLAIENSRLRQEIAHPIAAPDVAVLSLYPQLTRGNEKVPTITLAKQKMFLRVDLASNEEYPAYSVEVESASRGRIWAQDSLHRSPSGAVTLWLPSAAITTGPYEFLLYGTRAGERELLGSYPCRVEISSESPINSKPAQ